MDTEGRRQRIVLLGFDTFMQVIRGTKSGHTTNMPKDAKIIRFRQDELRNGIEIIVESKDFSPIQEHQILPNFEMIFTGTQPITEIPAALHVNPPEKLKIDSFDTGKFIEQSRKNNSLSYFRQKM